MHFNELRAAPPRPPRALLFWDWADFSSLPFFLFSLDAEFLEEFVAAVDPADFGGVALRLGKTEAALGGKLAAGKA